MLDVLDFGWTDLADVLVVSALAFSAITLLRRTRARVALVGLVLLGAIYVVARLVGLELTASILQGFFAVLVVILVVVFQDDLRRFFEQLGTIGWRRAPAEPPSTVHDLLVRVVARLASTRTGALFVLPGREPLDRHLQGGIVLQGRVSEPLLLSIFDPSSPGHDGAVVLRGERVERFAAHLPLSPDQKQLGPGGTRHAAALGLAERSDALCIVVSEERGTVSVAREGRLRVLRQPQDLARELRRFASQTEPAAGARWQLPVRWRDAGLAVALALVLWILFVPGSTPGEATVLASVVVDKLPEEFALESVEPAQVSVTLAGPRRRLVLATTNDVHVEIDPLLVKLGRRTFRIGPENVVHPLGLEVVAVDPSSVRISVRPAPPGGEEAAGAGS